MSSMSSLELWCVALAITGLVLLARVFAIYRIRAAFMAEPELRDVLYSRLPGYDEMAFAPEHWTRWTIGAWRAYTLNAPEVEKRQV
ncbi:hypothetical protein CupriaWKF_18730 [Cupriavidus sp. WKF15]|uniref:hypothetical protein n=1 Tax=Cupriavidus sp. WKF15 TaxID=3032282 RepID=UPI0023E2AB67|nr:hypothetical protein [Cupriavidus sp. WKF15]WER49200.1 hypothetical protein CupriaWKF_18730 [Cupriavidus sp. WKF15]